MDRAPDHFHLWRFLAGALYAYSRYCAAGTEVGERTDAFYRAEARTVLEALRHNVDPPGTWQRGFFYNAAIMRLDAAWERSLQILLNQSRGKGPALYEALQSQVESLPPYEESAFRAVRREVNALKHQPKGAPEGLRENPMAIKNGITVLLARIIHEEMN